MSKVEEIKRQVKKNRPSTLTSYLGETEDINDVVKDNDDNNNKDKDNNNGDIYIKNNNDIYDKNEKEYLKALLSGKKPKEKKPKKVFTSFYMDPDLAEELNKIVKNGRRGDKSKLINLAIRKLLQEYGRI